MMERSQVYKIIDAERTYQDKTYNPSEMLSSGVTRGARDLDVTPGIVMLESYLAKAREAWTNTQNDNTPALQQVAKVAAIAVRILERAGGSSKLLEIGLR